MPSYIGTRRALAYVERAAFSLDRYLFNLQRSFRFNLRKTDRFFQESTGITLADDVGETIGLALDQSRWDGKTLAEVLASTPELIVNGSFASGSTGWGVDPKWSIGGGAVTRTGSGLGGDVGQTASAILSGRVYKATWLRLDPTPLADTIRINIKSGAPAPGGADNFAGTYINGIGAQTDVFVAPATGYFSLYCYSSNVAISLDDISVKEVSSNYGRQTGSSTLRPTRQAEGAKFDGVDDNWLMGYLASAGSNFLMARTTVPVTLAGTQVIAGASGASANRFFVGVNSSGFACGGVGSDSTSTIVGTTDLRGTEADIAVSCDGSTVRLIVNGVIEYEAAQNSTPTTTIPFRVGAYNNNGTGGSYYAGFVEECIHGTDFLTISRFNQIAASIAANE